jgi:mannose/cellobiose epimerase-like protein (N-acyl-D-glucosamine 2-epimerase family)
MNKMTFTFSDLISGYVTDSNPDQKTFSLKTPGGKEFQVKLTNDTYAEMVRNLGESYIGADIKEMLAPGQYTFAYGIFYPEGGDYKFEVKHLVFPGKTVNGSGYVFEQPNWWIKQIAQLADFYVNAQFEGGEINYNKYRTNLFLNGQKLSSGIQEIDTISRTVYGFASAYLLTGEDRFLEAADKGTQYLRDKACKRDKEESEGVVYWLHALEVTPDGLKEHLGSLFGDDYGAIPLYEQIYALAGPTQTYRITGDPNILSDIEKTITLFNKYFLDTSELGGYYNHITVDTWNPRDPSLAHNQARKNWNSVGDHAPAYLINLWLATGEEKYADFLEMTFDTIEKHFPPKDGSPFVQEKFFNDWSPDKTWRWQQDRAVVGHDLKIAWNLMRMNSLRPKDKYVALATKLADTMPGVGMDKQRGGWYDVMERLLSEGEQHHRLAFHDRKAWWQQEQGILAYLILHGCTKKPEYLKLARESSAFYNAWFLDSDSGAVYFNVLANGIPYLLGTERNKGSHSMGAYHSCELAYLAAIYTNLLITKQPMDFYFKPKPGGFKDRVLRVQPDILPPGSIRLSKVWIDDKPHSDFNADNLTVNLPDTKEELKVKVQIVPNQ